MILDTLKNFECYTSLHKNFKAGFDFIQKALKENLAPGRYEIDGDALYASVQEYETHPAEGAKFEGHRKYIDLQFIASGKERMDIIDIEKADVFADYDAAIEAGLFTPKETPVSAIFKAGDFAVFFPQDLHSPGIQADGIPSKIKKIIVKIAI